MPVAAHSRNAWIYPAAWLALLTIYSAAFVTNGIAVGFALRNGLANLLPSALLGLIVLRLPPVVRWHETRKGRFFAAHLGLLTAFLLLSVAGWALLVAADSLIFTGRVMPLSFRFLAFMLFNDVLIYGTLAGVAYAWHNADAVAKAEALRARASLEAMRSQLNPHFILNTFHALVGLVRRDPAVAESALERLGDLLRYSLRVQRDGIDEVPLRDEYALVESYLELERLRLADRLRVAADLPPSTLEYLVPTFAVQILVENAVRHAIAPRAAGGRLEIRAKEIDGRLCISVKDDGNGGTVDGGTVDGHRAGGTIVNAATVDGRRGDTRMEGSRMGLRLLQERLAALYGNEATLTLRSSDTETCAELTLPARRMPEDER